MPLKYLSFCKKYHILKNRPMPKWVLSGFWKNYINGMARQVEDEVVVEMGM